MSKSKGIREVAYVDVAPVVATDISTIAAPACSRCHSPTAPAAAR